MHEARLPCVIGFAEELDRKREGETKERREERRKSRKTARKALDLVSLGP